MYDTELSPNEMWLYNKWLQEQGNNKGLDEQDYDLRGFFKDGNQFAANGHGTDLYKKPNHPTFSVESKYSTKENPGGVWGEDGTFTPSITNLLYHSPQFMQWYFNKFEPDTKLILPQQSSGILDVLQTLNGQV